MSGGAMSLKAKIRNVSREKGIPAQVVLQNYMFERFLERLAETDYKEKFIIKGGMLIAALVGVDKRATMDLDTTVKNYPVNEESVMKAIREIIAVELDDSVEFNINEIKLIRDDDAYGGFRVGLTGKYDIIKVPMHVDVTTGDEITPKEVGFTLKKMFSDESIKLLSYNVETVLAEKVETILRRSELNTRPRDFYDVYIVSRTQVFEQTVFRDALAETTGHRDSEFVLEDVSNRINTIADSEILKDRWSKYQRQYDYAKEIDYEDVIVAIKELML